jgi:hypothetical protein
VLYVVGPEQPSQLSQDSQRHPGQGATELEGVELSCVVLITSSMSESCVCVCVCVCACVCVCVCVCECVYDKT